MKDITRLKAEQFAVLMAEASKCVRCAAMCERAAVLSDLNGAVDARVMFIGEAPGRKGADRTRIPFSGDQSGKNFDRFLAAAGLTRSQIFITSAALCNPRSGSGANRRPTAKELRNCSDFLRRTIDLVDPQIIVTLGGVALEALKLLKYHEYTLRDDAAKIRGWNGRTLVPLYHPSPQVLITSRDERAQLRDYKVVARALARVSTRSERGPLRGQPAGVMVATGSIRRMAVTNSSDDYRAVRYEGAGIIDLSAMRGRLLVSGGDAAMFLNGLVTNDVKNLARGSWIPAAFANVQGRLIAAVRIIHRADGFLIDTESVTQARVLDLLDRFTLAGDFRVTDLTDELGTLSLQGRKSAEILATVLGEDAAALERGRVTQSTFKENPVTIIRATHTAEDGFDLFIESGAKDQLADALWNAGAEIVAGETFEVLRIEAGIPRFGIDMDENTVVSETCLDEAISDTKGCYVGQEIIIRIKHRGHVARKQTGILFKEAIHLEPGTPVRSEDGNEMGRVTSSTISPNLNQTIALAYLKFDYLKKGTPIKAEIDGVMRDGAVDEIPLLRSSWWEVEADQVPA